MDSPEMVLVCFLSFLFLWYRRDLLCFLPALMSLGVGGAYLAAEAATTPIAVWYCLTLWFVEFALLARDAGSMRIARGNGRRFGR